MEAASRNQIVVKYMKNGLRVEYTMGRLNTTYLLPGVILEEDFKANIMTPIEEYLAWVESKVGMDSKEYEEVYATIMKLDSWYRPSTYETETVTSLRDDLAKKYPVYKPNPNDPENTGKTIYYLDENSEQGITDRERVTLENLLKAYCPDLDHDMLDEMHAKTGYTPDVNETPVFRAAIEYVLQDDGLSVRLPASSIRFDETKYTLEHVKILQYFGAGNLNNDGYVFYPDGSGAIIEFGDFYSKTNADNRESFTLSSSVYGEDHAYYKIDVNAKHSEVIRVPVFGIVEQQENNAYSDGYYDSGFFAVLEDGDALADIATFFGGGQFNFAAAYAMFYPRPSDAYNLADAISVADNKEMTIVSDKKYTGFYKLKYTMLFDDSELMKSTAEKSNRFFASYSGMAAVYRDYLKRAGVISQLTEDEVTENKIPLYVETLGSVETVKKILSIPVTVDVPLTSFDDIETMYNQLAKKNITNLNFKLTGYANGGLDSKYPEKVKWVRAVGGKSGFADLQEFAAEKGVGIYPEFEFSYASADSGLRLKKYAARAVDDRYATKQVYDPVYQKFDSFFDVCVSPDSIYELVGKFMKKYSKYEPTGISVSTLGGDLNSNFNKDNPLNRQDAEDYIKDSLKMLNEEYSSVLAEGGNIYSVEYLDHILNLPLDASNYKYESKSVPFLGMVLHSYINYTGNVMNEAGDSTYQMLKAIENGSFLYYMLIYQNSTLLKEDEELSKYYSVRFDIWFNTIVEQYNTLNGAVGDLQLYEIVDHEFLIGERVLKPSELDAIVNSLDAKIASDLEVQYKALVSKQRAELRLKQIAQNLILAGNTTLDDLKQEVLYVLGGTLNASQVAILEALLAEYAQNGSFAEDYYNKTISVVLDRAVLEAKITAITGVAVTDAQKKILDDFAARYSVAADYTLTIDTFGASVSLKNNTTTSFAQDNDYNETDYTESSGRIVLVTYAKGDSTVHFVLNYNSFDVAVRLKGVNGEEAFTVPANGFCRINGTVLAD